MYCIADPYYVCAHGCLCAPGCLRVSVPVCACVGVFAYRYVGVCVHVIMCVCYVKEF